MHDCFDCDTTFENNKHMKVHLLVIHCDLDLVHDHKHSCGSHSTVSDLSVERSLAQSTPPWIRRGPVGLLTVSILNLHFLSKRT